MVDQEEIPLDREEIEKYLKDKHLSLKSADDPSVIDNIRSQKYLYFKLYKDIDVTDAEIRKHYNNNLHKYRRAAEVYLHQIVVNDKQKALEIRNRLLNSPAKFAEIARAESIARDKDQGGEMGYFQKGILPEDMERVVFALALNTISPVVESPYGFHIFKITKAKKERLLFLSTVKNDIKNELLSDKIRWAYEDFLSQLRTQLDIQIFHQALYFVYQPTKGDENNEINQNTQPNTSNNG
jgi:parvulin-like peptidyl-prolyl isomerase